MIPNLIPVQSSNIEAVGFNSEDNTTFVKFLSGSTYKYYNTPPQLFDRLLAADSIGSFFYQNYKYKFKYELVNTTMLHTLLIAATYLFTKKEDKEL